MSPFASIAVNAGIFHAWPGYRMNGALLVVPAGSLNSEVRIKPDAHLFVSSQAGWDDALETVPMVEKFPS